MAQATPRPARPASKSDPVDDCLGIGDAGMLLARTGLSGDAADRADRRGGVPRGSRPDRPLPVNPPLKALPRGITAC